MRVPVSWLREYAPVPASESGRDIAARLIRSGLEVETVDVIGADVRGPLVVGRVESIEELTEYKKPIRFCTVAVGIAHGSPDTPGVRGIICGAANFSIGDLVVVAIPGAVLPGDFAITARQTYGRTSDGMICSERELDLGENYDGIMVLPPGSGEVGDDAFGVLGLGEEVLDIAVTPDRGYALSVRGVAREAATAYGVPFTDPGLTLTELPPPADDSGARGCNSEDPTACDLFTLRTITGFDPATPTPIWMSRRLGAAGIRSIGLAVDITNYVMIETGQPLHAFDLDRLQGPVRARRARPGESLETLDHVVRTLDPDDVVIADDSGVIGLGGTMGGLTSEIADDSTNIALEAAHFDAGTIARMSRRHNLSSEASRRFERGVDPQLAPFASEHAAELLVRLGGGTYRGLTAVESPHEPLSIGIAPELPGRIGGLEIPTGDVVRHLESVGCSVAVADDLLTVTPPSWRPDLRDPYDLIEEVLRLVGYDRIPSVLPDIPRQHGLSDERKLRRRIGVALAAAGYVETAAFPFVGTAELDALLIPADDPRRSLVRLANPLSDEQPFLRTTLLPGLVAIARRNLSRGTEDLALFEAGTIFRAMTDLPTTVPRPDVSARPTEDELRELDLLLPDQPRAVAVLLTGDRSRPGWWGPGRAATWADAIAAAQLVAGAAGTTFEVRAAATPPFHPGRCAELVLDGVVAGTAGELHPRVIAATGLPARTVAMEVLIDGLVWAPQGIVEAPMFSTQPLVKEDLALVVDEEVPASVVTAELARAGGDVLESVRLFDEYRGDQLAEGKKSLAFALRLRAEDHTMTPDEVADVRNRLIVGAGEIGAQLR